MSRKMSDGDGLTGIRPDEVDFKSAAFINDPYPYYDLMRENSPILYREDWGMFFLTAFEDVNALLRDKRLGRSISGVMSREEVGLPPIPEEQAPFYRFNSQTLMDMEPPEHTRLKLLVMKAFTPGIAEKLRPRIEEIADELASRVLEAGQVDLLEGLATPLSVTVISELLGVPKADRHLLRPWSKDIVAMYELGGKESEETARKAVQAVEEFSDYLRGLVGQRRREPKDDLLSALVAAEEGGDQLSEDELIATSILILNAGHEATVNVVGNGMLALMQHQEQLALLRKRPELVGTAVEEMLRYDTPLPLFRRWVLHE
jgi:cytochrome P450